MVPTVNERLLDEAVHHAVDLGSYSNGVVRRILALLNRVDADLFDQLQSKLGTMDPDSFTVQRLESLLVSVRQLNRQAYEAMGVELASELRGLAGAEAAYQQELFQSVLPAQLRVAAVDAGQAYAAAMARPFQGRLLSEWAQTIEAGRMARIRDTLRMGYVENKTVAQMVREVRGTRARGYSDGLIEIDRRHTESIVRTAISHTAAVTRDNFLDANADLVKAVVWRSTLDSRTSAPCFPGETLALPIGALHCVSKRPFEGDMFVITTASGKQLRATGNHPVLTSRGWRAAKEVEPGKDVLCRVVVDVVGVEAHKDIDMKATLGAFADALNEPSVAQVLTRSTTEADFHGDGLSGDHEIYVPAVLGGGLGDKFDAVGGKDVREALLIGVELGRKLSAFGGEQALLQRFRDANLADMPTELDATPVQPAIKSAAFDSELSHDFHRAHARIEGGNDLGFVGALPGLASARFEQQSLVLEQPSDGGCGDAVLASDACGGHAVRVVPDDVVSVVSEFFSGHVFNLQTGGEVYIAGGFVVHNCRLRDGKQYTLETHKPIGHTLPWLGGPGKAHFCCRSTASPVVKSWKELTGVDVEEFTPAQRASMDGAVPADLTYPQWLQKQSAARQDEVLGPVRGRLLREGGLKLETFSNDKGRWLTLDQLRERNASAFERAGI